jgi:hypothetical protein
MFFVLKREREKGFFFASSLLKKQKRASLSPSYKSEPWTLPLSLSPFLFPLSREEKRKGERVRVRVRAFIS